MKRKSRLFYLALSVFLPPIAIMLLAATNLGYSQRSIETLAESYVENFTEGIASRVEKGAEFPTYGIDFRLHEEPLADSRFYLGLGRLPALFVVLDKDGSLFYGSERLHDLIRHSAQQIPMGNAGEVYDINGERFTVCSYPSPQGQYLVIGAVSWRDLPGTTLRTIYLWPLLVGAMALWSAIAVWRLWRLVIRPLGRLEQDISNLKWGEELPDEPSDEAVYELQKVHATLARVAQDAINRVSLIRTCINDIVGVQEAERTKISRDIHDGPLQDVTALIQRIHLARLPGNSEEDTQRELDLAEKIAQTTVREMRGLCDFLNPPWLELGLQQALTELTERQSAQYDIRIFLDVDEDLEFSDATTLAFFRVVQEAVTNSVRHGEAKNIWVDVREADGGLELCVQDDGHGFDMHESGTSGLRLEGHRGLSNMEERMALVGGRLKIISYPGEGTCIRGLIP